jgi:imidazoleglycerol phosphate dehydratase HisB
VEESVVSEFAVESKDGVLYITMPEAQTVVVYDITGRQVCRVACETGINAITHLQPGIYMVEKTKVYVER